MPSTTMDMRSYELCMALRVGTPSLARGESSPDIVSCLVMCYTQMRLVSC